MSLKKILKKILFFFILFFFQSNLAFSKNGWIGISWDQITPKLKEFYSLDTNEGLLISIITKGSPADLSGLKAGDIIISAENNKNINSNFLKAIVENKNPGDFLNLEVSRPGNERKIIKITVGDKKNYNPTAAITPESNKFAEFLYWPGWAIKTPENKISKIYFLTDPELVKKYDTKNWVITCLDKRSDLFKKGVKLYDEVIEINGQPINLYKYSNKPFDLKVKRDSKILTFRNVQPLITSNENDFICVAEFASMVCSNLLYNNVHDKNGKFDLELAQKNNLEIYECCEKNKVTYLPFLEVDEGTSLRMTFFKFYLDQLSRKDEDKVKLKKYVKIAEEELQKIDIIKKKFPDYKLPDSYYEIVDLLNKTNLFSKGFKDDIIIDYKKEENSQRLKNRIDEKVTSDVKNIDTLKLIENRSYFLIQNGDYDYLESVLKKVIEANYSESDDEYIKLLGKFYTSLSTIYHNQSDTKKLIKNNLDAVNWLKKKPISIHTRIINKNFLTNVNHSILMLDIYKYAQEFKESGWLKIDNYLNEFYLLSAQDQKNILEIDRAYLFDGYFTLANQNSWLDFSDKHYDFYNIKALEQIELNPKIGKHNQIYLYSALLISANQKSDEIGINKILLDVKRFLTEAKGDDMYLIAISNCLGSLNNFYSSRNMYAELEELLIFYEKLFNTEILKKKEIANINNFFYLYAKSNVERNKSRYEKSIFYLEKIVSLPQYNLTYIFSELRNKKQIDTLQQVTIENILPDLFDGYYKVGNLEKIKQITLEGFGMNIDNLSYKNLNDTFIVLHPMRIFNPLMSYYLKTNNVEKTNMLAEFIINNLEKITNQNIPSASQKQPEDFTYNANELIKNNQKKLAFDLYNKANDLVLKKYNNNLYNSIWKTTSDDINTAVDFLEGSNFIGTEEFFNKAYNTSQIIKNSNFSRDLLKAYISKKSQDNSSLIEYHKIQSELISLIKMEELKLTRSVDKTSQNIFKRDFENKKNEFNSIEEIIRRTNPEYFKSIKIEGIKLEYIQKKLKPNQAVLDYYFSQNKLAVVIIRNNSYNIHIEKISLSNLQDIKNNIRNTLQISKTGTLLPFDVKNSYQFNAKVFLNLKKYLENVNYLYIVPHGPLNEIPLHALPKINGVNCTDCSLVNWNFSDYTFNYLANLDTFLDKNDEDFFAKILKENFKEVYNDFTNNKNLKNIKDSAVNLFSGTFKFSKTEKNKEVSQNVYKINYLGIGDPDLYSKITKKDKSVENLNYEKLTVLRSFNLSGDTRSINIADFYSPLKGSREEILFSVKTFGEDNSKVWLKEYATETNLKETDLSKFNIIHFATHAEVSGAMKGLNEPFLVLSPPIEKTNKDNGLLMMNEIMQLNLNADLVILSACNTGSVEDEYSGSYSGLAKAFFVAGAKSVLVSNWFVEDGATQRLVTKFTENFSKDKGNFAENLNLTMKELSKQNNKYSHPIFWAPFVFVGKDTETHKNLN
jgi:CHAT domain-containing protein